MRTRLLSGGTAFCDKSIVPERLTGPQLSFNFTIRYKSKGGLRMKDINSLSHTKWRCQYHIVFAPKYRRQVIYGKIKADIGKILRKLCEQKGVEIIEATACTDHIHMLVSIPPNISVAQFMGYLKGKSSLMIFDRHANLKYRYGNRNFWCRGYYVDTVGRNKKAIEEYIKNQLQEDIAADQISLREYIDPFTGSKNTKA
jgi:putative transposase